MLVANRVISLAGTLLELLSITVPVLTGVLPGQFASVYSSGWPSMRPNFRDFHPTKHYGELGSAPVRWAIDPQPLRRYPRGIIGRRRRGDTVTPLAVGPGQSEGAGRKIGCRLVTGPAC
jgi:hypothetical protein